ncbi:Nucleoporin-like protein 2 [Eumeta japonica]|uniref:Nucleoporin-like protein 2 n=1 Tax=Eumeta variegata TaxID=151549 RepID=A0A4C1TVH6_EUMVA|nr:Nucleoporin-like protein 2 [Eumeta japonica]
MNSTLSVTDEQLVNQVQTNIQAALHGGQWILSTYAPFKEKPNFPGLTDISPEEVRLSIYEAKANNNLEQAISNFNNAVKDARSKYEQLSKPTSNIIKVLRRPNANNIFANAAQKYFPAADPINNSSFTNSSMMQTNLFHKPEQTQSLFGQSSGPPDTESDDICIYSKEEDLNPEDLQSYKNDEFQLGFIPELPPPRILCF